MGGRYPTTRTSKIKIPTVPSAGEELEPQELSHPAGPNATAVPRIVQQFLPKSGTHLPWALAIMSLLGNLFQGSKNTRPHRDLYGIAGTHQRLETPVAVNPATDEWINRRWPLCRVDPYCSKLILMQGLDGSQRHGASWKKPVRGKTASSRSPFMRLRLPREKQISGGRGLQGG